VRLASTIAGFILEFSAVLAASGHFSTINLWINFAELKILTIFASRFSGK